MRRNVSNMPRTLIKVVGKDGGLYSIPATNGIVLLSSLKACLPGAVALKFFLPTGNEPQYLEHFDGHFNLPNPSILQVHSYIAVDDQEWLQYRHRVQQTDNQRNRGSGGPHRGNRGVSNRGSRSNINEICKNSHVASAFETERRNTPGRYRNRGPRRGERISSYRARSNNEKTRNDSASSHMKSCGFDSDDSQYVDSGEDNIRLSSTSDALSESRNTPDRYSSSSSRGGRTSRGRGNKRTIVKSKTDLSQIYDVDRSQSESDDEHHASSSGMNRKRESTRDKTTDMSQETLQHIMEHQRKLEDKIQLLLRKDTERVDSMTKRMGANLLINSEFEMKPDEVSVFEVLVKEMGGIASYQKIIARYKDNFFQSCSQILPWFRDHKSKFTIFEKGDKLLYASVFCKDLALCFDYVSSDGDKHCRREPCEYFHVCRHFVMKECFRKNCRYSHDFMDSVNLKLTEKLGLNEFTNEEIRAIASQRYPEICPKFNISGGNCPTGSDCVKLHYCQKDILRTCNFQEDDCPLGHSFNTDHNQWVLRCFRLNYWQHQMIRRVVFVTKLVTPAKILKKKENYACDHSGKKNTDRSARRFSLSSNSRGLETTSSTESIVSDNGCYHNIFDSSDNLASGQQHGHGPPQIDIHRGRGYGQSGQNYGRSIQKPYTKEQRNCRRGRRKKVNNGGNMAKNDVETRSCGFNSDNSLDSDFKDYDITYSEIEDAVSERGGRQMPRSRENFTKSEDNVSDIGLSVYNQPVPGGNDDYLNDLFVQLDDLAKSSSTDGKQPSTKQGNKESKENVEEPSMLLVFKILVKELGGVASYKEISQKLKYDYPNIKIIPWFLKHRTKFTIFQKGVKLLYVSAFCRELTLCFDKKVSDKGICMKEQCQHFHICRDFLAGTCCYENCRYLHDFMDSNNMNLTEKIGLNEFTNEEVRAIAIQRYPKICPKFIINGGHCPAGNDCFMLHHCDKDILQTCYKEDCSLGHSFVTGHNRWVLECFKMDKWPEHMIRKSVFVTKQLAPPSEKLKHHRERQDTSGNEQSEASSVSAHSVEKKINRSARKFTSDLDMLDTVPVQLVYSAEAGQRNDSEMKVEAEFDILSTDNAGSISICEKFLIGSCKFKAHTDSTKSGKGASKKCPFFHLPLPYQWQINLGGSWVSLKKDDNQIVENGFCSLLNIVKAVVMGPAGDQIVISIKFGTTEHSASIIDTEQSSSTLSVLKVRRLSTKSYVKVNRRQLMEQKNVSELSDFGFFTQWRWHFKDDYNQWQMIEQDAFQFSLEIKYLANQKSFLFSRENFRFMYRMDFISFKQLNMQTDKTRDMLRRPVYLSEADIEKKHFPPALTSVPILKQAVPEGWAPWDHAHQFEFIELDETSIEFRDVQDHFFQTLDRRSFKIDSVYRVQNYDLWTSYCSKKQSMEATSQREGRNGEVNELYLFHGTKDIDAVRGICTNSIDFRLSGKNGTVYGDGAYFAKDAKYSHSYTNIPRMMFRVKVLAGLYTEGNSSYRRPPEQPGQVHQLFDSCVNSIGNPSIFVIFEKAQYYPEYLIRYKSLVVQSPVDSVHYPRTNIHTANIASLPSAKISGGHNIGSQSSVNNDQRANIASVSSSLGLPSFDTKNPTYGTSVDTSHLSARNVAASAAPRIPSYRPPIYYPASTDVEEFVQQTQDNTTRRREQVSPKKDKSCVVQ